jgi:hypothetical protein
MEQIIVEMKFIREVPGPILEKTTQRSSGYDIVHYAYPLSSKKMKMSP